MKKIFLLFVFFILSASAYAADHYIRDGGSGDGSTWSNAWDDLPTPLVRGDTYYMADGTYSHYTFDDAASGATYIYIKKATIADHGTETGWLSAYGDGQAEFAGSGNPWLITTAYWDIDGRVGSGKTGSSYGFKLTSTSCGSAAVKGVYFLNNTVDYIDIAHVWLEMCGGATGYNDDGIYAVMGHDHINLSCLYIHDSARTFMLINSSQDVMVEYCYFEDLQPLVAHAGGVVFNYCGAPANNTVRHCVFENVSGTCGIEPKDSVQSHMYFYGNLFFDSYHTNGTIGNTGGDTNTYMYAYNNTFVDSTGTTGVRWFNGSNNVARNNLWVNCTSTDFYGVATTSNNTMSGSTSLFTNYSGNDFTLSQATIEGYALSSPYAVDMLGNTRADDGFWDIGTYEYLSGGDTTPPVISSPLPSGEQVCTSNPRTINISIATNELATCKYDDADVSYDTMDGGVFGDGTFAGSGSTIHTETTTSLACDVESYTIYCRCQDDESPPNQNSSSTEINFSIASDIGVSVSFGGSQTITLGGSQTLTIQ